MQAFIVFSPDNKNVSNNLANNFKIAGIEVLQSSRRLSNRIEDNKIFSKYHNAPIFLIISDNFLKDKECMYEALHLLQEPALKMRIRPIVTDGKTIGPLDEVIYKPTKFEKVGNVIHYMNFWQDQYLEMRKIKKEVTIKKGNDFNNELDIIRNISKEIGEFLRILRSTDYIPFENLHKDLFKSIFRQVGWSNLYLNFDTNRIIPFVKEETNKVDVDISKIPGINLIPNPIKDDKLEAENLVPKGIIASSINQDISSTEKDTKITKSDSDKLNTVTFSSAINGEKEVTDNNIKDESNNIDASPLLHKVSDYKKEHNEEENNQKDVPKDNDSFEQEGMSYQDKSSYELLVSLFEDDNEEQEVESESTEIENASFIKEGYSKNNPIPSESLNILSTEEVLKEEESEEKISTHKNDISTTQNDYSEAIQLAKTEGDWAEASRLLKSSIETKPSNIDARYEYAMILSDQLKNYKEAQHQFNSILTLDNNQVETHLRLAELHELNKDSIKAKYHYEQTMNLEYEYPGLHHKYALLINNNFKSQKKLAIKHYKIAVQQDADNIDALYQYAVLQYEFLGKPKKALKKFQKVIQKEPNHPFANYDISVIYYELAKPKLAAQYYYDAYQNNPELKTEKNDKAFKIDKYLFKSEEETQKKNSSNLDEITIKNEGFIEKVTEENKEEVLEEIYLDDVSDLTGTFELTHIPLEIDESFVEQNNTHIDKKEEIHEDTIAPINATHLHENHLHDVKKIVDVSLKEIEDILEENDSFEDLEEDLDKMPLNKINEAPLIAENSNIEEPTPSIENENGLEIELDDFNDLQDNDIKALVMITGATSGIGKATAQLFAKNGHDLVITGRRVDKLQSTKEQLEAKYGIQVETLSFDVRDVESCKKALDSLDDRFKNIDILLNNAGLAKGKDPIHKGNLDHWETMIDTNIKGLLYMTRLVAPNMVANKKGHIINIGSIAGKEVYTNGNVYCATKHAVDALTKAMQLDLHQHHIKVSAIHPGAVEETEFSLVRHDFDKSKARDYQGFTPLNARDIADIVYFISTRPAHVNIQDLLVMATQQATATVSDNTGRKL